VQLRSADHCTPGKLLYYNNCDHICPFNNQINNIKGHTESANFVPIKSQYLSSTLHCFSETASNKKVAVCNHHTIFWASHSTVPLSILSSNLSSKMHWTTSHCKPCDPCFSCFVTIHVARDRQKTQPNAVLQWSANDDTLCSIIHCITNIQGGPLCKVYFLLILNCTLLFWLWLIQRFTTFVHYAGLFSARFFSKYVKSFLDNMCLNLH